MQEDLYTKSLIRPEALVVGGDEPSERKPGRVAFHIGDDGELQIASDEGSFTFVDPVSEAERLAKLSPALARIEAARAARTSLIEAFELEGEIWYLLRMNQGQIYQVAIRMRALGDGGLTIVSEDNFRALVAATLQVGVVKGQRDPSPYFSPEPVVMDDAYGNPVTTSEVLQWISEPGLDMVCAALFDRLTDINPKIWPKKKEVIALAEAAVGGAAPT